MMLEKHFRYTGIYFHEIDSKTDIISSKSFFNKISDRYYNQNMNKYFEVIKFRPVLPSNSSNRIEELLLTMETFEVKCIADLVKKRFYPLVSSSEADYAIKNTCASKKIIKADPSNLEFEFDTHKFCIRSFNDGLLLFTGIQKKETQSKLEDFGDFQFISFKEIDCYNLQYHLSLNNEVI